MNEKPEQRLRSVSDGIPFEWMEKRQKEIVFFEENANWNEDIIFWYDKLWNRTDKWTHTAHETPFRSFN